MAKGRIIIIDDDPTQRLLAARDMQKIGADTVLPESVSDLLTTIDPDSIGLCITDRWLGDQWHAAADEFIGRLPPHVPVWEWTCDQWGQPILHRVERVIFKRPGELLNAVQEWIERKV